MFGARFHHPNRNNSGPKLLADCLPGEQQEVGVLLFALATHEQGYRNRLSAGTVGRGHAAHRRDEIVAAGVVPLDYEITRRSHAACSALLNLSS